MVAHPMDQASSARSHACIPYLLLRCIQHLVDGDKIATLAATFFSEQLRALGVPITGEPAHPHEDDNYDPFAPGSLGHVAGPLRADGAVSVGVVQVGWLNRSGLRLK